MSQFSGKCDLRDWIEIVHIPCETPFETYRRHNMELIDNKTGNSILIQKPSDLVPYYPYYDAAHVYERDKLDKHWLCPPEYNSHVAPYYKRQLEHELKRVQAEEDPKYV